MYTTVLIFIIYTYIHHSTHIYVCIELNLDLFKKTLGPVQKVLEDADLGTITVYVFTLCLYISVLCPCI